MSASSAASGGATGLDPESPQLQSVFRRHPLASGIAAAAIAVVVVSGLTAWGVGTAVTASLTSSTTSVMPMGTATPTPAAGGATGTKSGTAAAGRLAFRATIQSMDASSWTILTKRGQTVTVAIDSTTQFGTKKMAQTAEDFAVGDSVIVVATKGSNGSPTASRVVNASALGNAGNTSNNAPMPSMSATPTT